MRTRARSSVGVVLVGLVPALVGGPVFAAVLAALCLVGYQEYLAMAARLGPAPLAAAAGYAAVAAFAAAALLDAGAAPAVAVAVAAVWAPLVAGVLAPGTGAGAFAGWALTAAGAFYLGLPAYAGVAVRRLDGGVEAGWLESLAGGLSFGWAAAPRGLGWFLVVLLVTWIGDTAAYLVGRAFGRRPLIPRVSPKKTVEGSLGGLAGSALVGAAGVALFGLGVHPLLGALVGLAIGAVGQVGDLAESLLKRQVGVKDSGTLIPGHGGVLDRIDALLFTLPAGWLAALAVERVVR